MRLDIPNGRTVRIHILLAISLPRCWRARSETLAPSTIWERRTDKEERKGDLGSQRAGTRLTDITSKPRHFQSDELGTPSHICLKSSDLWSHHIVPTRSTSFTQKLSHSRTTAATIRFYIFSHRFTCGRVWLSFLPPRDSSGEKLSAGPVLLFSIYSFESSWSFLSTNNYMHNESCCIPYLTEELGYQPIGTVRGYAKGLTYHRCLPCYTRMLPRGGRMCSCMVMDDVDESAFAIGYWAGICF